MWDDSQGGFFDRAVEESGLDRCGLLKARLRPLASNCDAARVLLRLPTPAGERDFRERALATLAACAGSYRSLGVLGAPYGLAIDELARDAPGGERA